jgi:ring-1,2-phenylacetyl-CoA epoxidase subunit PaaC
MAGATVNSKCDYVLRLADSTLILSQRLTQWLGKGPALEEDMALANISLDLIGQSRMWFSYAGELEGAGRDEDQLAFLRDTSDFRNLLLVEQPNGNYADTSVRQFFFDAWHHLMLKNLIESTDRRIAEIAEKALTEVDYHQRRSTDLVVRIGDGTPESHRKTQAAVDELWMYTGEMFEADEIDRAMSAEGVAPPPDKVRSAWLVRVGGVLDEATLTMPSPDAWMQKGGKRGRHGEHLGYILTEMQFLQRAYPGAQW